MGKKFRTHVQGESLQKKIDADYEQYFCIWGFFLAFFVLTLYIWLFYLGVWNITLGLAITFSVFTFGVLVYGILKSLKLIRHIKPRRYLNVIPYFLYEFQIYGMCGFRAKTSDPSRIHGDI